MRALTTPEHNTPSGTGGARARSVRRSPRATTRRTALDRAPTRSTPRRARPGGASPGDRRSPRARRRANERDRHSRSSRAASLAPVSGRGDRPRAHPRVVGRLTPRPAFHAFRACTESSASHTPPNARAQVDELHVDGVSLEDHLPFGVERSRASPAGAELRSPSGCGGAQPRPRARPHGEVVESIGEADRGTVGEERHRPLE